MAMQRDEIRDKLLEMARGWKGCPPDAKDDITWAFEHLQANRLDQARVLLDKIRSYLGGLDGTRLLIDMAISEVKKLGVVIPPSRKPDPSLLSILVEAPDFDAGSLQRLKARMAELGREGHWDLRTINKNLGDRLGVAQGPAAGKIHLKLGISLYLIGQARESVEHLGQAEGALAAFYLGRIQVSRGKFHEALEAFEKAEKAGYNASQVNLLKAGVHRHLGRLKEAGEILERHKDLASHSGEYQFQLGLLRLEEGHRLNACESLEKAVKFDPTHSGALFHLALLNDQAGNDEEALALYERCSKIIPVHVGTLTNLGILYEDMGRYDKAHECFRRVLDANPADERARLFVKDALASQTMVIAHDDLLSDPQMSQIYEVSVNDFELSVRARNCLKRLNIKTLGDLTRVTEDQLLTSKNFGETSLIEINEILASKGLRLGQSLEAGGDGSSYRPVGELSEEDQLKLAAPVSDLQLSVRARKCMNRLGLSSIAELVSKSAEDLMEARNFGVTSLNEVREKLRERGLSLRGE